MKVTIYCKTCSEYKEGNMQIKIGSTIFRPKACTSPYQCLYDPPINENDPDKWIREESRWALRFGIGTNRQFGYLGMNNLDEVTEKHVNEVNRVLKEEQDNFNKIRKYEE